MSASHSNFSSSLTGFVTLEEEDDEDLHALAIPTMIKNINAVVPFFILFMLQSDSQLYSVMRAVSSWGAAVAPDRIQDCNRPDCFYKGNTCCAVTRNRFKWKQLSRSSNAY